MTNGDRIRSMTNKELAELINNSLDFFSCNDCMCEEGSPVCIAGCIPFIEEFLGRYENIDGEDKQYRIYKISHSGRKGLRDKPVEDNKHKGMVGSIIISRDVSKIKPFQKYYFKFVSTNSDWDNFSTSEVIGLQSLVSSTDKPKYMLETANTLYYLEEI